MLQFLFRRRVRAEAKRLFGILFPNGYRGEVLLCGGAFKSLFKKNFVISDLDLWVRNDKEREILLAYFMNRNARLIQDFRPFCIKFQLERQLVEITYNNVASNTMENLLSQFDLALCGIGSRYANGRLRDVLVTSECWSAVKGTCVNVQASYINQLQSQRLPQLLSTLHRMRRQAAELNYQVNTNHEIKLWEIYWKEYSESERNSAFDFYSKTIMDYKGQRDEYIVRGATHGVSYAA